MKLVIKPIKDMAPALTLAPVELVINHVDSSTTLSQHIDADSTILTAQLALLMQVYSKVVSLDEVCELSNQVMKTLKTRRELCLKATSKAEADPNEIDITPMV